jgi:hypothetical protein
VILALAVALTCLVVALVALAASAVRVLREYERGA